jgi:acyl-coenzyme A thioesterase PaaI-like protein
MDDELLPRLDTWRCWGCGGANEHGLGLRFRGSGPHAVLTEFTLPGHLVGIDGVAHGGVLATVFDDTMAWALIVSRGRPHFTVEMTQRYRRPAPVGRPLVAEGEHVDDPRPGRFATRARLWLADEPDTILAEASGLFAEVSRGHLAEMDPGQVREFEDLVAALGGTA